MMRSEKSPSTSVVQSQAQEEDRFESFHELLLQKECVDLMRAELQPTHEIVKSLKEKLQSSSSTSRMSHLSLTDRYNKDDRVLSKKDAAFSNGGAVWGGLYYKLNNVEYDCIDFPTPLPHPFKTHHGLTSMHTDGASFMLLLEKDSPFTVLGWDKFFEQYGCILLFYTGEPDVSTVPFLRKMRKFKINLPVLAFVDWDPKGLKLLHKLKQRDPTLDIMWLGFRYDDFEKYKIPKELTMKMTNKDFEMAKELYEDESFRNNRVLTHELEIMLQTKKKAESEIVYGGGSVYLEMGFLPLKFQRHDWICL